MAFRKEYPDLSQDDVRYITKIKIKEFGKLSRKFLTELKGCNKQDGEMTTILRIMWETNDNLMEILSDKYTFREAVEMFTQEYYTGKNQSLKERLDEMRVSNSVRRPVYRTLAVVKDIEKAFGKPDKIFVEMTRGGLSDQKGKRTKSRKQQILELYAKCREEDVRDLKQQLESMGRACGQSSAGRASVLVLYAVWKMCIQWNAYRTGKAYVWLKRIRHRSHISSGICKG